ncbi:hypothetical protein PPL_10461 [Heterostelium album PN500]|uniref:Uncharacterized protein n=1 Tax=Heterostelium pallidum (strain ATCC 26659 / Pp 5 / PN500) TaxID=670386 RepID=D3BR57_HETP5|nr:hypothetical protein PPL_10461 [Heterostelium album PN500]EFA75889.1 hypothetical protein PPL_10461 [Heterostelium album PN500]|eukprot:XP_020428023.1 hypothetical protein PPL_10461 [Heterostelium album PN500]
MDNEVLPSGLKSIHFGGLVRTRLNPNILPQTVESINFSYLFRSSIYPGDLPENLLELKLHNTYKRDLGCDVLPKSLQSLEAPYHPGTIIPAGCQPSYSRLLSDQCISTESNIPLSHANGWLAEYRFTAKDYCRTGNQHKGHRTMEGAPLTEPDTSHSEFRPQRYSVSEIGNTSNV